MKTFLLLGSNMGDRLDNLKKGCKCIQEKVAPLAAVSSVYETAAWGNEYQPAFLNQAIEIETSLEPEALLKKIKSIERAIGRRQAEKWGPRIIDIDILLMETVVFKSPSLTIPHPQMHERRFTLVPLAEIAPAVKHPLLLLSVKQLLKRCKDRLDVRHFHREPQAAN